MNDTPETLESFDPDVYHNEMQQKSRNIWLLSCGIITAVLLSIFLCIAFIGGIFAVVTSAMRSSVPYQDAMTAVQTNPEAVALLGEPIEAGWFVSGSISTSGASGEASLSIPVSGPRGEGTIFVEAEKSGGQWTYYVLALEVDGHPTVIHLSTSE